MRHSATRALLERKDVIVVASVSYLWVGAESYQGMAKKFDIDQTIDMAVFLRQLSDLQYTRNDVEFKRGLFRVRGDRVDLFRAL